MSTGSNYLDGLFYRAVANNGSVLTQRPVMNATGSIKAVDNPAHNRTDLELDPSAIDATAAGASIDLGTPTGSPAISQAMSYSAGTVGQFMTIVCTGTGPSAAVLTGTVDGIRLACSTAGPDNVIGLSDVINLNTTSTGEIQLSYAGTDRIVVNSTGIGFFASSPVAKPTVAGSRGGNAALASLLTALSALGLVTDSTTA